MVGIVGRYSQTRFPEKNLDELTRILTQAEAGARSSNREIQTRQRNVRKRLGDERIQQLITEYKQGDTTILLMERYSLSKTAVLKILRDNGVLMRRQPLTQEQATKAKYLYLKGDPIAGVAKQINASTETTRLSLIAAGVQMRPRARQARL